LDGCPPKLMTPARTARDVGPVVSVSRGTFVVVDAGLPEVVLTLAASVDGRVTLGRHQRLLDAEVAERWAWIQARDVFASRHQEIDAHVVLEGSGSFVDVAAEPPRWPPPTTPEAELWRDYLPHRSSNWFVVGDGRGRVEWTFTGDATTRLHVLVCRATPAGYLQRLRDLNVGYFVVGDARVDLRSALVRIRRVFDAPRVIANSGGTINASLLRGGLVDVLDVVTLPGLVGGLGTPSIMDGPPLEAGERPIRLRLLDCRVENGAVRTRYRVQNLRPD